MEGTFEVNAANIPNLIMAYEDGGLSDEQTYGLFQLLINNGMAWSLQGHYGRTATAFIEQGHCIPSR